MKFLIDQQLPPALAQWLAERNCSAEHVRKVGLRDAEDNEIWKTAAARGMAIITKDEDFAARRARVAGGPAIVWLRIGNATNEALREWLEPRWEDVERSLKDGSGVVEVR
jgi:predicted nuclease of predicted toxin-antitoxin system